MPLPAETGAMTAARQASANPAYRRRMLALIGALGVWLALPGAPPAAAQPIDMSQGGPITVTAENGLEWQQEQQEVIATGHAQATRGNVTVTADRLIAHYRRKAEQSGAAKPGAQDAAAVPGAAPGAGAPGASAPTASTLGAGVAGAGGPGAGIPGAGDTGSNEIYRLEAVGDVHIDTQTDHATGDHATYDIDQAVMLMTGHNLKVTTPNDILTSRDSMEYWTQKHMAVARGEAIIITNDGRRIAGDVLVAYTTDNKTPADHKVAGTRPAPTPVAVKPGSGTPAGAASDPLTASGKLQKVEAIGNVTIRTQLDYVTGDRGVYVPDSGIARVAGHVRITRGQNQLNGEEAEVNLKTNISRLLSAPNGRVQGLVLPNDASAQGALPGGQNAAGDQKGKPKSAATSAQSGAPPSPTQPADKRGSQP